MNKQSILNASSHFSAVAQYRITRDATFWTSANNQQAIQQAIHKTAQAFDLSYQEVADMLGKPTRNGTPFLADRILGPVLTQLVLQLEQHSTINPTGSTTPCSLSEQTNKKSKKGGVLSLVIGIAVGITLALLGSYFLNMQA